MEKEAHEVGQILKTRRTELKMTMEEVAEKCGVNKSTVSRWESGFIKDLKRNNISVLCQIFHMPADVLFGADPSDMVPSDVVLDQREIIAKVEAITDRDTLKRISGMIDLLT